MSDSSDSFVVAALTVSLVLILTLITVIVTLSLWLLKLRRRLYKESQVNSDVVPSQNDKGQHDEICGDVFKYEVGVVILPSKVQKVQRCVKPPSDDFTICSTPTDYVRQLRKTDD